MFLTLEAKIIKMISFLEAIARIDQAISPISYSKTPKNLYDPIHYILTLKGKKIRPALTLLACNLYQDSIEKAISPALAWEIFHNFTLMHDDLMDHAEIRRSQPTVHKMWNANTAILSGDAMLIMAYQHMASAPADCMPALLHLFSSTAIDICEGQQYDMDFEQRPEVSEAEYLNMIRLKTAVLIGACLKSGAIVGGANETDANHLYDFGVNFGLAFQIMDDLLDVYGSAETFGKNIGGDILCNKKTYLLTRALELATGSLKQELLYWINNNTGEPQQKISAVTEIYNQLNIKSLCEEKMNFMYSQALHSFHLVNITTEKKKTLLDLVNLLMKRET